MQREARRFQKRCQIEFFGNQQPIRRTSVDDRLGGGRWFYCRLTWFTSRTPQAEIEAAWVQRIQQTEFLHRGQRRAVPHLDCARTEPNRRRFAGGQSEHHCGGSPGHPGVEMVFGEPVARVTEGLGLAGEIDTVTQGLVGGRARRDRDQVEHVKRSRHNA